MRVLDEDTVWRLFGEDGALPVREAALHAFDGFFLMVSGATKALVRSIPPFTANSVIYKSPISCRHLAAESLNGFS